MENKNENKAFENRKIDSCEGREMGKKRIKMHHVQVQISCDECDHYI